MAELDPPTSGEKATYGAVAWVVLGVVRAATACLSTRDALELSSHIAEVLCARSAHMPGRGPDRRELAFIELALQRVSDYLPATRCLQRAIAARLWLAHHGHSTEIVLGVGRDTDGGGHASTLNDSGPFRGHAWVELPETAGELPTALLDHADVDYRVVYRG